MTLYSDQHGTIVKTKQQEPGLEQADQAWPRDLRTRSSASSSTGEWPGTTPRGLRTRCSTTTPSHALSGALGILTSPELPRHSTCPRASEPVSQSPGERPQKPSLESRLDTVRKTKSVSRQWGRLPALPQSSRSEWVRLTGELGWRSERIATYSRKTTLHRPTHEKCRCHWRVT